MSRHPLAASPLTRPGISSLIAHLAPMPHEWIFGLFLVGCWLRLAFVSGVLHPMSLLYAAMFLFGVGVMCWERRQPTPLRARLRVLCCAAVSTLSYASVKHAVPAMYFAGFTPKDGLLESCDRALVGNSVEWLQHAGSPWMTEVMMTCYLFFFYYLITGPGHYYFTDHRRFIACGGGFFTVYGLGYIGYVLVPAAGPCEQLGLRTGGIITQMGSAFVSDHTNGFDAFPSIHFGATCFLLGFDWRHHRRRFWRLLVPTLGLWVSTVYLRYHYLVDLLGGLLVALVGLWIADRLLRSSSAAPEEDAAEERDQVTAQAAG